MKYEKVRFVWRATFTNIRAFHWGIWTLETIKTFPPSGLVLSSISDETHRTSFENTNAAVFPTHHKRWVHGELIETVLPEKHKYNVTVCCVFYKVQNSSDWELKMFPRELQNINAFIFPEGTNNEPWALGCLSGDLWTILSVLFTWNKSHATS